MIRHEANEDTGERNSKKQKLSGSEDFSRIIYTLGEKALNTLRDSSFFISGINGLGLEIVKNLALVGVKRIVIHDKENVDWLDLSTQFFLNETHIGQNRAKACLSNIRSWNEQVNVDVIDVDYLNFLEMLKEFQCVVLVQETIEVKTKVDEFCRSHNIKFISADNYGLFGSCFSDFGSNFLVTDNNGEPEKKVIISYITQEQEAEVHTLSEHDFQDGDIIQFEGIVGMEKLNFCDSREQYRVKCIKPDKFKINANTSSYPIYSTGGVATQIKQHFRIDFKSLAESIVKPEIIFDHSDELQAKRNEQLHIGFRALDKFRQHKNQLPQPWDNNDAHDLIQIAKELDINVSEDLIRQISFTARGSIVSITATIGGIAAQEAIKSVTGKFMPINQWLYFDAYELLENININQRDNFLPIGSRYDASIICIGKDTQEKLSKSRIFIAGAGTIGCEIAKNIALLGVSTSSDGEISVADFDIVNKSNLTHQFLYRESDLGSPKSQVLANAISKINPAVHIKPYVERVGSVSENTFGEVFLKKQDIVINALDSVRSRLYTNQRCVAAVKPLLESGISGTKGHVQVIVPHLSETYAEIREQPEVDYPHCVVKSFPYKIEHTIEWTRQKFKAMFYEKPKDLAQFFESPQTFLQKAKDSTSITLSTINYIIKFIKNPILKYEDCIRYSRQKFDNFFKNAPNQLLYLFPAETVLSDGNHFWKAPKRICHARNFDESNPIHVSFIWNLTNLLARLFSVSVNENEWNVSRVLEYSSKVSLKEFTPKRKTVVTNEKMSAEEASKLESSGEDSYQNAVAELNTLSAKLPSVKINLQELDVDNETNFHVGFYYATANMRALVYTIDTVDQLDIRRIAGHIYPSIATTSTTICGLISLELIKIIRKCQFSSYRNRFINLGLPEFISSEPGAVQKLPLGDSFYTVWDSWEVNQPDITLKGFMDYFKERKNLTVTGVILGAKVIYGSMFPGHKQRLPQKLVTLLGPVTQPSVELVVSFADDNGDDVETPSIRFYLK